MPTQLIDIHPHIISPDTKRYPVAPLGGKRSAWSQERPVDFDGLVAGMNAAGIDKAAIVHSSTTYGYDNSYVADAVAEHRVRQESRLLPDAPKGPRPLSARESVRFAGVFSVDVGAASAVSEIRHWVNRGLSGLRLFAAGSTVKGNQAWIADAATFPAWRCCEELGIPVAISMRQEGLPHLAEIITRFPKVRIVIDHLLLSPIEDGPPYRASAGLFGLAAHPQVFLKMTTNNIRRCRDGLATPETFFGRLVETFGSSRIAWGSNFPNETGTLAQQVDEARAALAFLPATDRENIFRRTAMTLYPSLADRPGREEKQTC